MYRQRPRLNGNSNPAVARVGNGHGISNNLGKEGLVVPVSLSTGADKARKHGLLAARKLAAKQSLGGM